jgi:four helix bundle protein
MSYKTFEELPVWQKAAQLYNKVLDLFESHSALFSPGFRNQLDRAALSVSNNIAEGFERMTTGELISFLAIARGSAGEVRSMLAVIKSRKTMKPIVPHLDEIMRLAHDCVRQISGWITQIEASAIQGKRHQTAEVRQRKEAKATHKKFRTYFLQNIKSHHPLYDTEEARQARAEPPVVLGDGPKPMSNSL